jgi:hypothetical protein
LFFKLLLIETVAVYSFLVSRHGANHFCSDLLFRQGQTNLLNSKSEFSVNSEFEKMYTVNQSSLIIMKLIETFRIEVGMPFIFISEKMFDLMTMVCKWFLQVKFYLVL